MPVRAPPFHAAPSQHVVSYLKFQTPKHLVTVVLTDSSRFLSTLATHLFITGVMRMDSKKMQNNMYVFLHIIIFTVL